MILRIRMTQYTPALTFTQTDYVKWAFTTFAKAHWIPVTFLSHLLDFQFYDLNAKGQHLTSLVLHIANALILFLVLSRMTGKLWHSGLLIPPSWYEFGDTL
jgi:hypothetical protein